MYLLNIIQDRIYSYEQDITTEDTVQQNETGVITIKSTDVYNSSNATYKKFSDTADPQMQSKIDQINLDLFFKCNDSIRDELC